MPVISALKESFAIAPIQDRNTVVQKLAVANTNDAYFYQGLLILQQIYDEVMKQEDPLRSRSPTPKEAELAEEMRSHLKKLKPQIARHNQLKARFHLLVYPFETATSIEYLKKEFSIDTLINQEDVKDQNQEKVSTLENNYQLPSSLNSVLLDPFNLIKQNIEKLKSGVSHNLDVETLAYPYFDQIWNDLSRDEQIVLVKTVMTQPTEQLFGNKFINRLASLFEYHSATTPSPDWNLDNLPFNTLTLDQMDQLIDRIPHIILLQEKFVYLYLEKLVPNYYQHNTKAVSYWDNDTGLLTEYLNRVEVFAEKLPHVYKKLISAIKFYRLRIDIVRQDFNEDRLICFLASTSYGPTSDSPIPTRGSLFKRPVTEGVKFVTIELPLFGSTSISDSNKHSVIKEYLFGLIVQQKLTKSMESLGEYLDYHQFLKPTYAELMLTTSTHVQESWIKDIGYNAYERLASKSSVSFANSSLNASVKRKPADTIKLYVKTKNIPRLSIRVFQIDTENYWRIHLNDVNELDSNNKINLDGLCPTFEKDIDYSSDPAIRVNLNEFKFGNDGLASDVFKGRGLWVIEFVGGQNQCRAIVQKGYLRHIIQNTLAGHIMQVLDEEGQVIEKAKVLYQDQAYKADESSNILIPYLSEDSPKTSKIILVSMEDNYCEPASFEHLKESYELDAAFYVNSEMISFNKKSSVTVIPKVKLNDLPVPLSFLKEKLKLTVETTDFHDIKSTTTYYKENSNVDAFYFEFMVPDQLQSLSFNLKAKVKTIHDKTKDLSASHSITYSSPDRSGVPASAYLKKNPDSTYCIQVFGKNGEFKKNYNASIHLKHRFISSPIETSLQTNDEGTINLGDLKDIEWVQYMNNQFKQKIWYLRDEYYTRLPPSICISENINFKVPCNTEFSDSLYSLYAVGNSGMIINNVTKCIKKENGFISIQGLPEGEYNLHLPSSGTRYPITCTVIKPQLNTKQQKLWSNWIVSNTGYAENNGSLLQKPLGIAETNITQDSVQIQLDNWSPKAYAVITTNTFVPCDDESLYSSILNKRHISQPVHQKNDVQSTRSLFLNDKRISEEYQYILNRSKADKWTSSSLTKPSLLVYPKKNASTDSIARDSDKEVIKNSKSSLFSSNMYQRNYPMSMKYASYFRSDRDSGKETGLAFLNHHSPIVIAPVSPDSGCITVNRKDLGYGGNLLQMVVISGEQTVFKQQLLDQSDSLRLKDLRQNNNSNKALIRSKVISKLQPNDKLTLFTHEYETIDSFEKLFDVIINLSSCSSQLASDFAFLKTWTSLDLQQKLDTHKDHVCHEFNLWLKKKDVEFFNDYIKPVIKSKIHKDFMDLYLADEDLSKYQRNMYLYNHLSVAEKALFASTQSKEYQQSVLRSFKDALDYDKPEERSDVIFDTILSQSTLSAAAVTVAACYETEKACDMAYISSPHYSPQSVIITGETESVSFGGPPPPPPPAAGVSSMASMVRSAPRGFGSAYKKSNNDFDDEDEACGLSVDELVKETECIIEEEREEEDDDEDDIEIAMAILREKAKAMQKKKVYKYIEPTSEWCETGYYYSHSLALKKFWVDYLENLENNEPFLSTNFMYSLDNVKEIIFVLSLMDLPFASETNWSIESMNTNQSSSEDNNRIEFAISTSNHALLVFYRTLYECENSVSSSSNQKLMLSQEIFVVDDAAPIESDECIKIDPSTQSLEPLVEYGNHLIVSNVSSKTLTCQITVQIPIGAVPTQYTSYCQSRTISIDAYSTWHEIIGTFYFPESGNFTVVPVTISTASGDQLLGKIDAIPIRVSGHSDQDNVDSLDSTSANAQSWTKVASKGSNDSVISFIESYRKLEKLDFDLIKWRMTDRSFARQVLDILIRRHHRIFKMWQFGFIHQFNDIIQDILQERYDSLNILGTVFESPLLTTNGMNQGMFKVYDYYPLLNARSHQLKSTHEILNQQFNDQYNKFLEYLCMKSTPLNNSEIVILTTYLILQDRIGEAQDIFSRVKNDEGEDNQCQVQIDYIQAYLKTRLPVTKDMSEYQAMDFQTIKDIASKYKNYGALQWKQLFANLHDYVNEIEQGDLAFSDNSTDNKRIRSEPILEFEVDEGKQELVLRYANLTTADIKYYDMNVEVMFSNNPFINSHDSKLSTNENISWIKPSYSETIPLPEKQQVIENQGEVDDFSMIGIGQVNSLQTIRVPFATGNKNVFIQVSSGSIRKHQAYYSNTLITHVAESFGVIRVMSEKSKKPLAGVYVKVYCLMKSGRQAHFWKDGYTGLNGVFDYISVTQGNALLRSGVNLKSLMTDSIEKLSILILSEEEGAIVKEVYPPIAN